ncbi:MAG TPA: amidohydrolase family protein, partial [Pyrinomonadaceae bacterium]|nr:amidohydrolase family protein [Pyrinomonadaceae bacterium]
QDLKPYIDTALEYFGPSRMMFGSDWPVCLLAASYEQVLGAVETLLAEVDEKDRQLIFSKNAYEFYRIQEEAVAV